MKKIVLLFSLVLIFVLSLTLSGCFGLREKPHFVIARDTSWYPLNLLGQKQNMVGFTNDLFALIAEDEEIEIEFVYVNYHNLYDGLERKVYDAGLTTVLPNPILQSRYFFSDPFFLLGPVLVVPMNSSVRSIEEMDNKLIGIPRGSPLVYDIGKYPNIRVAPYETPLAGLEDLREGRVDGVVVNALVAYTYVQGFYAGQMKVVTSPLSLEGLRVVTTKGKENAEFIAKINSGLTKLRENNQIQPLLIKWGFMDSQLK